MTEDRPGRRRTEYTKEAENIEDDNTTKDGKGEKGRDDDKTDMKYNKRQDMFIVFANIIFAFFLLAGFVVFVQYVFFTELSYESYVTITRVYSILSSQIGISAVIAIAGLCFNALRNDISRKKNARYSCIFSRIAWCLLFVIAALSVVSYKGMNAITQPFGEEYSYIGQQVNGMAHGEGRKFDANGNNVYVGSFRNNQYNGNGILYMTDDSGTNVKYEGSFKDGLYDGTGKLYSASSVSYYEGVFAAGDFIKGTHHAEYDADGFAIIYDEVGNFQNYKLEGYAEQYWSGKKRFEGNFVNGIREGYGYDYDDVGRMVFEGNYSNGDKNGAGKEYDTSGNLIFEGTYKDNQRTEGFEYLKGNDEALPVQYQLVSTPEDGE